MVGSYNVYNTGDAVILTATFHNAAGELANPAEVDLRVKRSSGEVDTLAPQEQTVGVWQATYDLVGKLQGEYRYRWEATGVVQVAGEGAFYVLPNSIPT